MPESAQPVVKASNLTKRYRDKPVVDGVSFAIHRGEFVGILGPNGAGKTTTLRMLVGNIPPSGGNLSVLNFEIPAQARAMRARIGVVQQADCLDPDFTVVENLRIYGRYFDLPKSAIEARIPTLLSIAALSDKKDERISQLSGGMRRRLAIARALINRPEILVLDEPTTGLDPQIRQNIWALLRTLQQDGLTLILTTHYMDEAERLCGRIIVMDRGRILADATPEQLIRDHIEPHVLELHGGDVANWQSERVVPSQIRCERVGESWYFYGADLQELVSSLDQWPGIRYNYRPANLEDVFLVLTGRDLRDG